MRARTSSARKLARVHRHAAARQAPDEPDALLRSCATARSARATHRRAAPDRCRRGCDWHRCRRAGSSASISVAPCARRDAPQPRDVRVLGLPHHVTRRRVIEVVGIPLAGVRRVEHQRQSARRGGSCAAGPPRAASCGDLVQVARRHAARRDLDAAAARVVAALVGIACGQRGWKWQPGGGSSGDGISPLIGTNVRLRGSTLPTSASSACV